MKLTLGVVALATLVVAGPFAANKGTPETLPKCAVKCLEKIVPQVTSCQIDDHSCLCLKENQNAIIKVASKCLFKHCTAVNLMKTKRVAIATCKAEKAKIDVAKNATIAEDTTIAHNTTIAQNTTFAQNTTIAQRTAVAQNTTFHFRTLRVRNNTGIFSA